MITPFTFCRTSCWKIVLTFFINAYSNTILRDPILDVDSTMTLWPMRLHFLFCNSKRNDDLYNPLDDMVFSCGVTQMLYYTSSSLLEGSKDFVRLATVANSTGKRIWSCSSSRNLCLGWQTAQYTFIVVKNCLISRLIVMAIHWNINWDLFFKVILSTMVNHILKFMLLPPRQKL